MIVTYQFRLLPRRAQHRALERILEAQRLLYNAALEERIDAYRKAGLALSYFDQAKHLTEWRESDAEARALPVTLQRATLQRVDLAYRGFFERVRKGQKPGFPRFQSQSRFRSFGFAEFRGISLQDGWIRFKGCPGSLRVHWHRELPQGTVFKSCTIKREKRGWTLGIAVLIAAAMRRAPRRVVGLDLGIATFAALSDGGFIPSLRAARNAERKMRIAQRALSRKHARSGRRRKCVAIVGRLHSRIARRRHEHLHQASARMVRDYDVVVIEKLRVGNLSRGPLAKHVHDAGWAKFIAMLRYKAEWAGARVIEVNPHNTTQQCSGCGALMMKRL